MQRMVLFRRFLIVLTAMLLVWRIGATGMSAYYVELLNGGDKAAASKALAWDGSQPVAMLHEAVSLREQDPDAAAELLVRANGANPTDPRPFLGMADLALAQGDESRSEALVATALDLVPADPRVQRRVAGYWISRGDLERAMRHWSLALEAQPGLGRRLFPVLLDLAENPDTRSAFMSLAQSPPSWWVAFFEQVAKKAQDVGTVQALYGFRRASTQTPIMQIERKAYVARMEKEGIIVEAYVHWINGLTDDQRRRLALVFDGGFELEPGNWGFEWQMHSEQSALVDRAKTHGIDGSAALHLLFRNHEKRFDNVSQTLFLGVGAHRLTGRVRTDNLESEGGLKWVARCLGPEVKDLGESDRFLGSNEWREFAFEFDVPASCSLQEIRLVSAGERAYEYKINGDAWFDRLAVRKIAKLTRAPNTELQIPADETGTGADSNPSSEMETTP
ncbi:MAG: tetratricopeptide repeat protein [Chromatiaceae bacterium]|nr:tetratricopeptide repeat protein [Chromatiaceae bacterium]